nr:ATP-binding protein [Lederbergia citrisecunda]
MICGKVCSGKSTYTKKVKEKYNAVVLSCDDLMLTLYDEQLGSNHNAILNKCKEYLYGLAEQTVETGTNVILDFGFWYKSERDDIRKYFNEKQIKTEIHFIHIDDATWKRNIEKRNQEVKENNVKSYYIDGNMISRFEKEFETPDNSEVDYIVDHSQ